MANTVDEYLSRLAPHLESWAVMTQQEREQQRRNSSAEALREFYDAMLPEMEAIMELLNQYPLDAMPENARRLMNLTLSLAEVAPHVEFYSGDPAVPFAFAEERFIAERAERIEL